MSVVYINEALDQQNASSQDERTEKSRSFWLRLTATTDDASAIQSSGYVPVPGDFHPTQSTLRVSHITVQRAAGQLWKWTAHYRNQFTTEQQERATVPNPLDRNIVWDIAPQTGQRPVQKNISGRALLNSARDVQLPLHEVPRSTALINGRKNCSRIPDWYWDLTDYINTEAFYIAQYDRTAPPKTLLFRPGPVSTAKTENGFLYMVVHFSLESREHWQYRRLDQGYYMLDENDSGTKKRILVDGEWPSEPVLLDGGGMPLDDPSIDTAYELEDDVIETRSFSPILYQNS